MSSFTRFNGELNIVFSEEASAILGGDYWQVRRPFVYYVGVLNSSKYVEVPEGFLSDGASVPSIARIFIPMMGRHSQAAFLHDYLCETYRLTCVLSGEEKYINITRREIDHIFYEALKVSKFPAWKILIIRSGISGYRILFRPKKPRIKRTKLWLEEKYRNEVKDANL